LPCRRLLSLVGRGPDVVVDLSQLTFMGATGVGVPSRAWDVASKGGRAITLSSPTGVVARVLSLTGPTHHRGPLGPDGHQWLRSWKRFSGVEGRARRSSNADVVGPVLLVDDHEHGANANLVPIHDGERWHGASLYPLVRRCRGGPAGGADQGWSAAGLPGLHGSYPVRAFGTLRSTPWRTDE
jgi:hypothetical protein